MRKELIFGLVGLVAGLSIGFFGANSLNKGTASAVVAGSEASSGIVPPEITEGSIDELLQKANDEPQNFPAQMKTGDLYAQIGKFEQAIEFYKRGLILQPENFQANVVLANALFDAKRFEEAEGYYTKALSINEKDVNARVDLGATFVERSQPDYMRAIAEFEKAITVDAKSEPAIFYLGIAHLRKGDKETALKILSDLEKVNAVSPLVGRLRQDIESPKP